MSVLDEQILSTVAPDTSLISSLSYESVFLKNKVKPCSIKSLVKYAFLSMCNDFGASFTDEQFECVTGNSESNPFQPIYESLSLTMSCTCSLITGNTVFTVTSAVINSGYSLTTPICFIQFFNPGFNSWQFVLDANTGNPFQVVSGTSSFEPQIQFDYSNVKFRIIDINSNKVSPLVIVEVLECSGSNFILQESGDFILRGDGISLIETE